SLPPIRLDAGRGRIRILDKPVIIGPAETSRVISAEVTRCGALVSGELVHFYANGQDYFDIPTNSNGIASITISRPATLTEDNSPITADATEGEDRTDLRLESWHLSAAI